MGKGQRWQSYRCATGEMMPGDLSWMSERYEQLTAQNLQWSPPTLETASTPRCTFDGSAMIMLSANNYLNLTTHPKVIQAMVTATQKYGAGSGSVRAIAGTMEIHLEAEKKVAEFKGVEAATERQRANYRRVFGFLDANRDKRHSKKEYVENGRYMTRQARQGIFRASDSNQDGFVSEEEYVVNRIITDEAKEIFFKMDVNRDSRVTLEELVDNGKLKDPKLAKSVFQALDGNGDGELVIPEYLRVWGQWARSKPKAEPAPGK